MGQTPVLALPYPEEDDSVDIVRDITALAESCVATMDAPGPWVDDPSLVDKHMAFWKVEHCWYRTWGPVYTVIFTARFIGTSSTLYIAAGSYGNLSGAGGSTSQEAAWPYVKDSRLAPFIQIWDDTTGRWVDPPGWPFEKNSASVAANSCVGMMVAERERDNTRIWGQARQLTGQTRVAQLCSPNASIGVGKSGSINIPANTSQVSQDLVRFEFTGIRIL
jgi:hypothetical protein